jgi:RNA polymerase sigma-70 factor, ECF subfamily
LLCYSKQRKERNLPSITIEAAIAAVHMKAPSFEETNWKQLLYLYNILFQLKPGPVVALNRAIVLGYAQCYEQGIAALQKIRGLSTNHFYYAALGNFYQRVGNKKKAAELYTNALRLANTQADKDFLQKKIERIG